MGVRFECPQGHKLHVKAHLAGQRGICPECGARFVVPSFSGGRVAVVAAGDSGGAGGDVSASLESSVSFNAGLSQSLPPATAGESATWYLRPVAGGQFGPVDTDSFRQWVDQGRVPEDALVWRSGWPEWKRGGEAVRAMRAEAAVKTTPPPPPIAAAPPMAVEVGAPAVLANGQAPMPKPVDAIYAARRRRRQMNARVTVALGILSIVLLAVLLFVLTR
jgi:hypothetical protein